MFTAIVPCKLSTEGAFALLNGDWRKVTILDPEKRGGCIYEYLETSATSLSAAAFKRKVLGSFSDQ